MTTGPMTTGPTPTPVPDAPLARLIADARQIPAPFGPADGLELTAPDSKPSASDSDR